MENKHDCQTKVEQFLEIVKQKQEIPHSICIQCQSPLFSSEGLSILSNNLERWCSKCWNTSQLSGLEPFDDAFLKPSSDDDHCIIDDVVKKSGKRRGAFAVFIEIWHQDILDFLSTPFVKKNDPEIGYHVFVPKLFTLRAHHSENWSLFCPLDVPKLLKLKEGKEFDQVYCDYESDPSIQRQVVNARELWIKIIEFQHQNGTPFLTSE